MIARSSRKLKHFEFVPANPDEPRIMAFRANPKDAAPYLQPHVHRFLFLIYFERGGGWQRVGVERRDAKTGDLLRAKAKAWIVCFTPDALDPSRPKTGSYFYLLNNPLLLPFLRSANKVQGYVTIAREARSVWSGRLQALEAELRGKQTGYREAARAQLTLMLVDAARLATKASGEVSVREQPLLTEVFNFIEAQYAQPISSVDVSEAVGRSSAYLTTLVRQLTGRTVLQWTVERRMAEARRLLLETDETVAAITKRVGYTDPTYFIRQFRRSHDTTPDAWRHANR